MLLQKDFQAKDKIANWWENITYKVIKKLTDVPVYKIHELPKLGEDIGESHPLHTKVVHRNMLFQLDWTVDDITGGRDDNKGLLDHKACTQQDGATNKMNPGKMLV